jgi:uncharacterized protein HemX
MELDIKGILTVLVPVLLALVMGFFSWMGGRKKASADVQAGVAAGFQLLVTKLQEERATLVRTIDDQSQEITKLRGDMRSLMHHVARLEAALAKHDIQIPGIPNADDPARPS